MTLGAIPRFTMHAVKRLRQRVPSVAHLGERRLVRVAFDALLAGRDVTDRKIFWRHPNQAIVESSIGGYPVLFVVDVDNGDIVTCYTGIYELDKVGDA